MDETRIRHLVSFGALMLLLVGAFNLIDGTVALVNPDYLHRDLLVGDLTVWGWCVLVMGVLQILTGIAVLAGSEVALWPGLVLAMGNALVQLTNAAQYPVWSIAMLAADVLVMFAFAARGLTLSVKTVDADARPRTQAHAPEAAAARDDVSVR
jgi:hypothetical protein